MVLMRATEHKQLGAWAANNSVLPESVPSPCPGAAVQIDIRVRQ
jgi:hypothetical protein